MYVVINAILGNFLGIHNGMITYGTGLAIPLGVLFGGPAIIGVTLGVVLTDISISNISTYTFIFAFFIFLLAAGGRLAYRYGLGIGITPEEIPMKNLIRYTYVTIIVCMSASSIFAWGHELIGQFNFYYTFAYIFIGSTITTFVITPLVWIPVTQSRFLNVYTNHVNEVFEPSKLYQRLLITIPFLWALFGIIGSLGFVLRERMIRSNFASRGVEVLYDLIHPDIFGQGGRRAQVVWGTFMLLLLIMTLSQCEKLTRGEEYEINA